MEERGDLTNQNQNWNEEDDGVILSKIRERAWRVVMAESEREEKTDMGEELSTRKKRQRASLSLSLSLSSSFELNLAL